MLNPENQLIKEEIESLVVKIKEVEDEIKATQAMLSSATDAEEIKFLRQEKTQLRAKEDRLRDRLLAKEDKLREDLRQVSGTRITFCHFCSRR